MRDANETAELQVNSLASSQTMLVPKHCRVMSSAQSLVNFGEFDLRYEN